LDNLILNNGGLSLKPIVGGIEAGGTKCICVIGSGPGDVRAEIRIPTADPQTTTAELLRFIADYESSHGRLSALGIASFGPLDLSPNSPRYGSITSTPKPGWSYTPIKSVFEAALHIPVAMDTDVNVAAFGEYCWGAARGLNNFIYLTIGTGIGGGGMVNGQLMHGLTHPEMGHVRVPQDRAADPFDGICPFHGNCLEGLASGPALEKRWGRKAETIEENHPAWILEAQYLGYGLVNYICTLSPEKIILGGGVMDKYHLFSLVRSEVVTRLNGYILSPMLDTSIDAYICPPALGSKAGVYGALALALREIDCLSGII
jgi:fructokinase